MMILRARRGQGPGRRAADRGAARPGSTTCCARSIPTARMVVPAGIWLVVALALIVGGTLGYTRFGRHLFSIGSNERTARLCGVPVERTKIAVYTAAAALAGVAGVLQFSRLSVGDPTVAVGLELGRHCRRHHRRRQPVRRARVGHGNDPRRVHDGGHPDRLLAAWASELGAADRHRRHHRARGRPRSLEKPEPDGHHRISQTLRSRASRRRERRRAPTRCTRIPTTPPPTSSSAPTTASKATA